MASSTCRNLCYFYDSFINVGVVRLTNGAGDILLYDFPIYLWFHLEALNTYQSVAAALALACELKNK